MTRDEAEAIAERHAVKQDGGLYSEVLSVYGASVAIMEAIEIDRKQHARERAETVYHMALELLRAGIDDIIAVRSAPNTPPTPP